MCVLRGGRTESVHAVHGVVVGLPGGEEAHFGDPSLPTYWRSAMKPFQALPVVADGAAAEFGFGAEELALCCASHGGSALQVGRVRAMLERVGASEDDLACGPHPPFDLLAAEKVLREGGAFGRLHNNCSGKHAGMLALAALHRWDPAGYERLEHPVQARLRAELARWLDGETAVRSWSADGCGVPTPFLPLRSMARAYARLIGALGESGPAAVVGAMTAHPELTSAPGRFPLALMRASDGRLLAKEGAEGVLCAAAPEEGWAMALKVADGGRRAVGPAAVEMLAGVGLLDGAEQARLARERRAHVRDTRGAPVGEIVARLTPRRVAGA